MYYKYGRHMPSKKQEVRVLKKNLKKTFAKATALAMAVAMMVSLVPADSAAAKKAKKPKLAKSVKVTVKKTKKVKIKNTKKIKKTKWSIKSKKVATISKKKKTSVVVKGKKAGKSTTLTAKVTLKGKKKALKLKCKVKVVKKTTKKPATKKPNTPKPNVPTPKPGTPKPADKTPAPTPDKIGDVEVDSKATLNIPITALNETCVTSDAKHTDEHQEKSFTTGAEYGKNGLSFTTTATYNGGHMFYLDPITSADDLMDAPEGQNNSGNYTKIPKAGKGKEVDIADYDYLRVTMKSAYEINTRLYSDLDQFMVDGAGFPANTAADLYGNTKGMMHPSKYYTQEAIEQGGKVEDGANHYFEDEAKTKELKTAVYTYPVKEIVKKANGSKFIGVAVCGQFKNQEYVLNKIEFLKVKDSKPADKPVSVVVSAAGDKTAVVNGATLQMSAKVLNKNEVAVSGAAVTWSVTGDAATISDTGLLTADATKTGKVTVTATSKTDTTVKGTYEVTVSSVSGIAAVAFSNEYTTYTIDEVKNGLNIAPKALNGAGEPVPVASQPAITVTASDASDGISYADGKLTATKAGSIKLTATSGSLTATVTIKVVDGMRVELTADNIGAVIPNSEKTATATVSGGVITCEANDWNAGAYVKVAMPAGKTVANVAGILWTLQIPDAESCDQKPGVTVRYKDDDEKIKPISKPSQGLDGGYDCVLWQGKEYTAADYAKGVDLEAAIDWNFCYKNGADVTIDTSGDKACFTLGKNGPSGQVQKVSNVIILWGEVQQMPALKSVTVSEPGKAVSVPLNKKLSLAATAVYENDKTKTVTETARWASNNDGVATVDKGVVTPVAKGTVKITAAVGEKTSAEYTITVDDAKIVQPVTLTNTKASDSEAFTLEFEKCTGWNEVKDTFDITDFTKVTIKVVAQDASGNAVTDATALGDAKVCVNCKSSDYPNYNYGWGEGIVANYLKKLTADGEGVFTITATKLTDGAFKANCLSMQIQKDVKSFLVKEIKFEQEISA